jgi:polyisoprenoid-binding protein YceI
MNMSTSAALSEETLRRSWEIDPRRSSIGFRVRSMWGLVTVSGYFDDYSGELDLSAAPAIELTIEAASVNTGNPRRDQHLRSSDFFDAENHPRVRFVSDRVRLRGGTLEVTGSLSACGNAIPLELEAQVRHHDGGLELVSTTTVRHRELGMTWSPLGVISPRSELIVRAHLVAGR